MEFKVQLASGVSLMVQQENKRVDQILKFKTWHWNWSTAENGGLQGSILFPCYSLHSVKMADCVATGDSSLYVLPLIKDRRSEYICKKCSAYESQLKEVLEELESAKTIINIL